MGREKKRQNPSKALRLSAEEGVNKPTNSNMKKMIPDSKEG